jgi:hypothetical protein
MGRKTRSTGPERRSNSDKKIEKLYIEAIRNAKEGRSLPSKQATEYSPDKSRDKTTKKSKRPEQILEEAIRKQQEQRKPQRRTFSVPVSRLVPFKNEAKHGFQFPRDFKKDDLSWVPRSDSTSTCGMTEYDRSLWGEFSNGGCVTSDTPACIRPSTSTDNRDDQVEHILHVLPLRSSEEDCKSSSIPQQKAKCNLPPIYRTSAWTETVTRCHGARRSIPSRGEGWRDRGSVPLLIGREELHIRTPSRKNTVSLAERRVKMEQNKRRRKHTDNTEISVPI